MDFRIIKSLYCLPEVYEQAEGGAPAFNVIAIRYRRHANVSKQRMLLADVDVVPPHGTSYIT